MTRSTSSILVSATALAVGFTLFSATGEARSVFGRLYRRYAHGGNGAPAVGASRQPQAASGVVAS